MANLITEGFDWFPAGQSAGTRNRIWGANEFFERINNSFPMVDADVTTGRFSFGQAISLTGKFTGGQGYVATIGATPATGFLGAAVYVNSVLSSLTRPVLAFFDAVANGFQIVVSFESNGVIKVWRGGTASIGGVLLATSVAGVYQENQWFHCEVKTLIAGSGGTVEVRINTVPVIQLVGANTQSSTNPYFDSIFLGGDNTGGAALDVGAPLIFDDLFVNDTTGTSNNTWAGNLRVKTQFMIANGATDNFTIGGSSPAATQWQSVLNQVLDDTKYVYSPTPGDIDLFTPDPNLNAPVVRALQVRMGLRQDDATQRVARGILRIGGVNYLGVVDQYTNQTYTFYKERWQLSPATGVSFTGAEVNGLQAGVKVQA